MQVVTVVGEGESAPFYQATGLSGVIDIVRAE